MIQSLMTVENILLADARSRVTFSLTNSNPTPNSDIRLDYLNFPFIKKSNIHRNLNTAFSSSENSSHNRFYVLSTNDSENATLFSGKSYAEAIATTPRPKKSSPSAASPKINRCISFNRPRPTPSRGKQENSRYSNYLNHPGNNDSLRYARQNLQISPNGRLPKSGELALIQGSRSQGICFNDSDPHSPVQGTTQLTDNNREILLFDSLLDNFTSNYWINIVNQAF